MLQCLAMSLPVCFHQLTESCLRARHCLSPHLPPHLFQRTSTMLGIKHLKATIHCLKQMSIKIKVKETSPKDLIQSLSSYREGNLFLER